MYEIRYVISYIFLLKIEGILPVSEKTKENAVSQAFGVSGYYILFFCV